MNNNDIISSCMSLLRHELAPYIAMQLMKNPQFKGQDAWWELGVEAVLKSWNLPIPRVAADFGARVDAMDMSICLNMIDAHWNNVFRMCMPNASRSWAKEIKDVRNRWAHFGEKPFSDEETRRAVDTMALLAGTFDEETKKEIEKMYRQAKPSAVAPVRVPKGLLAELSETGAVTKTHLSRKLTIDGVTKAYPVYKIRLDLLYYNDQNDRIATWLSQYNSEHPDEKLDPSNREAYNDLLESFIVASNPEAITRTQNNIELVDQREPAVVLIDGRIVDGNRRFTCLRRLSQKSERFGSIEAIILDRDIEHSAKQIKMLELSIQHGEESKVEYNSVDRTVGIYNDIVKTKLLTVAEYARSTNEPESRVRERIAVAQTMADFLEFISAPEQFYIIREMDLASTFDEAAKVLKLVASDEEREALKLCLFTNILMHPSTDQRKYLRDIKAVLASDYAASYLEEQKTIAAMVVDSIPRDKQNNLQEIRSIIAANDSAKTLLKESTETAVLKSRKTETRNRPIQLLEKATVVLDEIDVNIFKKMNDSEKNRAVRQLQLLQEAVARVQKGMLAED